MTIPLVKPFVRRKDLDSVLSCLVEDKLAPGEVVRKFTQEFSHYLKADVGVLFHDPVQGLKALFKVLGLLPGEALVLSPLAPSYVVQAGQEAGLVLLFADVEENSPVISVEAVKELESQNPKAVYADSTLGYLPDVQGLKDLGLLVVEDISHSVGAFRELALSGANGDAAVAFLGDLCNLNAGGGLLILVRGRKLGAEAKEVFGLVPHYSLLGDMNASLALSQFHHLEKILNRKKELYRHLFHSLSRGYRVPQQRSEAELVPPWLAVLTETGAKDVIAYAKKKGVEAALAFEAWDPGLFEELRPHAKAFWLRCVVFPLHPGLTQKETELLGKVLATLP